MHSARKKRLLKIKTIKELLGITRNLKKRGKKIVLCSGVFDLVHPGHIDYFEKAHDSGDVVIVSVVDDKFVTKGPHRPIFSEKMRINWLASLESVDYVVLNGGYGPHEVMRQIRPDVFAKGKEDKVKLKDPNSGISKDKKAMDMIGGEIYFVPELVHSTEIFNFMDKKLKSNNMRYKYFNVKKFYGK